MFYSIVIVSLMAIGASSVPRPCLGGLRFDHRTKMCLPAGPDLSRTRSTTMIEEWTSLHTTEKETPTETSPKEQWTPTETTPSEQWTPTETTPSEQWTLTETTPSEQWTPTETTPSEQWTPTETTPKEQWTSTETTPKEQWTPTETTPKEQWTPTETTPSEQWTPTETTPKEQWTTPQTEQPTICPQNTTAITIIPDKDSCQKFYVCVMGKPIEYSCDDDEEFEPSTNHCVPISDNGCTASKLTTTSLPETTTEPPALCKPGDTSLTIIPDPEDCLKFYMCFMGQATQYTCPNGSEFDPISKNCSPISDHGCTASKHTTTHNPTTVTTEAPTTPTTLTEAPTTVTDAPTTPTEAPTTTTPLPSPICKPGDNALTVVADPEDCQKFYTCFMGQGIQHICQNATEFDPITMRCVPISDSGCTASKLSTTSAPTTLEPTTPEPTTLEPTTPEPTTLEPTTPEPTTLEPTTLEPTTLEPTTPEPTTLEPTTLDPMTTPAPSRCPQNSNTITVIADEKDCTKFYICFGGLVSEYTCTEGTEFDPVSLQCVPISDSGCTASKYTTTSAPTTPQPTTLEPTTPEPTTPEPTTAEPTTPELTTPEPTTLEPTTLEPTTPEPTTLEPSTARPTTLEPTTIPAAPRCPQNSSTVTVIADEDDCTKFYICFSGSVSEYTCIEGTEFDPLSLQCVPISNSGCTASKLTTTAAPTTPQPTTPEPTTPELTTPEPTTLVPTTAEPTTLEPTTPEPTTPELTTLELTTPEPTTLEPTTSEPTTTPAAPACPQNSSTITVIADENDCAKFYVCFGGSVSEYTCIEGMEFDPVSLKCITISDSGCTASELSTTSAPTTPQPTTLEPTTPELTTAEPTTPEPTTLEPTTAEPTTPEPTTLEPTTAEPTTPEPTTLEPTTAEPTTPEPTTLEPTTAEPTTPEPTTPNPTTFEPTTTPAAPRCPQNSSTITVIANEEDCAKFYVCFGGSVSEYTCIEGMEFDPVLLKCVSISESGCTASKLTTTSAPTTLQPTTLEPTTAEPTTAEPTTAEPTTSEPSTPEPTTLEPSTPEPTTSSPTTLEPTTTPAPPRCPQNSSTITVIADEEDCTKFYVCFGGSVSEYTCIEGMEFDPVSLKCVPISDSGCTASKLTTTSAPTTPQPTTLEPTTAEPTTPEPTTPELTTLEPTTLVPTTLQPTTAEPTTPEPTTPEPTTSSPTTLEPTTTPPVPRCPQNSSTITVIADEEDCTKFYVCFGGSFSEFTCEEGTEFDPNLSKCSPISDSGCTASKQTTTEIIPPTTEATSTTTETLPTTTEAIPTTTEAIPTTTEAISTTTDAISTTTEASSRCPLNSTTIILIPHESDCNKFYICFAGSGELYACGEGLEFDPHHQKCEVISDSGCTSSKMSTTLSTTPTTTRKAPQPITCRPGDANFSTMPHETDCSKYYMCLSGQAIQFQCKSGYEYEPVYGVCVPISDVGCTASKRTTLAWLF